MNYPRFLSAGAALLCASAALASIVWSDVESDILILGEIHDNPEHHARQQNAVNEVAPVAVVYEMLTPEEAAVLDGTARTEDAMRAASAGFHWTNIGDYAGILAASPRIVGAALPRHTVRSAFQNGAAEVFGENATQYGLTKPVPNEQLDLRKTLQFEAHCQAMPIEMMGGMVEAQRLRDAAFARTVVEALDRFGAPVVLITGNGHARMDWGVPVFIQKVRPDASIVSVGQGEDWQDPAGSFSWTISDAPSIARPDPCAAFK